MDSRFADCLMNQSQLRGGSWYDSLNDCTNVGCKSFVTIVVPTLYLDGSKSSRMWYSPTSTSETPPSPSDTTSLSPLSRRALIRSYSCTCALKPSPFRGFEVMVN